MKQLMNRQSKDFMRFSVYTYKGGVILKEIYNKPQSTLYEFSTVDVMTLSDNDNNGDNDVVWGS